MSKDCNRRQLNLIKAFFADELVIFVVFAILVVNGVQHAVCVTSSTSVFKTESVIREREK